MSLLKHNLINGVLLFDKPYGLSSQHAISKVKNLYNAKKIGHTGTLDPLASGLLPLCFGEATKFSQYLINSDKSYEATICLGICTSTGDSDGVIISTSISECNENKIQNTLPYFLGESIQVPPMYSAIKYKGKPLYKYARLGIFINRKERYIKIYTIKLISCKLPYIKIYITCSKGTYIRVLAEDIGKKLGYCGAYVTKLRRVKVSYFGILCSVTLEKIRKIPNSMRRKLLCPIDVLLYNFPALYLDTFLSKRILYGNFLHLNELCLNEFNKINKKKIRYARIYNKNIFLGLAEIKDNFILPIRLLNKL